MHIALWMVLGLVVSHCRASMPPSRRQFLQTSAAGVTLVALPTRLSGHQGGAAPHYFLHVILPGGWDPSYLCDARPLAMTAAGLMQNYLAEEPRHPQSRRCQRAARYVRAHCH